MPARSVPVHELDVVTEGLNDVKSVRKEVVPDVSPLNAISQYEISAPPLPASRAVLYLFCMPDACVPTVII